jgi:hypothetical protein
MLLHCWFDYKTRWSIHFLGSSLELFSCWIAGGGCMCCAHLFGWSPAWDAVEVNLQGWLHFSVHGLRPYWFRSNYELLFPEKCLETSHPSTTQIICRWWFIIKANVLLLWLLSAIAGLLRRRGFAKVWRFWPWSGEYFELGTYCLVSAGMA